MAQGPWGLKLVTIRISFRIQESEIRTPDSLDIELPTYFDEILWRADV